MSNSSDGGTRVVSVNISTEKGTPKRPVPEIAIDERGVLADAHHGQGFRHVSMIALESIERFAATVGRQFTPGEFAENITTQGLDLRRVAVLDTFRIGPVELEVTQIGKECHGGDCAIFRAIGRCVMPKEGIFCRAIAGGTVRPGDSVAHATRALCCRIITVSDRASRGEYEDRSGPRAEALLAQYLQDRRWRAEIETSVVPDEAEAIRAELTAARDAGVDVIITTGGTGIGPRDVTPDVAASVADRIIPGIMEHIRVKFGSEKPNALLSRSIAGVVGRGLIYTLPGSQRAVEEYMGEILKTLEHSIFMMRGLDVH